MVTSVDYKKYIIVFVITALLFFGGFYLNNYFNSKKIDQLKQIQNSISIDILSSETQFSLLTQVPCSEVSTSVLSQQLSDLAEKLDYGERTIGIHNPDIISLRQYFSLLEIKDYLLMQKISQQCHVQAPTLIYFYKNIDCPDCGRQWNTISELRNEYPEIRAYVFDYDSNLSAVKTIISMFKVPNTTPVVIVKDKVYTDLFNLDSLKALFPEVIHSASSTAATTTKTTVKN